MKFEKISLTLKGLVAKKMIKTHQIEKKTQIFTNIERIHTLSPMSPRDRKIYLWQKFTKKSIEIGKKFLNFGKKITKIHVGIKIGHWGMRDSWSPKVEFMLKNEYLIVEYEKIHIDTKGNEGFLASTSGTHVSASL
jgi:hypothetical protein